MKGFLLLLMLTFGFFTGRADAQSAEDSIKATINTLFAAMKSGNGVAFKNVF